MGAPKNQHLVSIVALQSKRYRMQVLGLTIRPTAVSKNLPLRANLAFITMITITRPYVLPVRQPAKLVIPRHKRAHQRPIAYVRFAPMAPTTMTVTPVQPVWSVTRRANRVLRKHKHVHPPPTASVSFVQRAHMITTMMQVRRVWLVPCVTPVKLKLNLVNQHQTDSARFALLVQLTMTLTL